MKQYHTLIFVAVLSALFLMWFLITGVLPANAHDNWINSSGAKSVDGTHCCGKNDCFVISADDMKALKGGWLITSLGEIVPYSETQMSEDQDFWRCKRWDNTRRCFFAPPQGF